MDGGLDTDQRGFLRELKLLKIIRQTNLGYCRRRSKEENNHKLWKLSKLGENLIQVIPLNRSSHTLDKEPDTISQR